MRNVVPAVFDALALSPVLLFAQANHRVAAATPPTDHEFVMRAVEADMAEVEVGKIAEKQSSNDLVKRLATRMVTDHEKALNELKSLARKENMRTQGSS